MQSAEWHKLGYSPAHQPTHPSTQKYSHSLSEKNIAQRRDDDKYTEPEEGIKSHKELTQMLAEFISEMRANLAQPAQQYFQTSPPW